MIGCEGKSKTIAKKKKKDIPVLDSSYSAFSDR